MFTEIKNQIKELAKNAVFVAEKELGSGKGQQKKTLAIKYIVDHLPFSNLIKNIISILLSSFIDDVVEIAVTYMKSFKSSEGE